MPQTVDPKTVRSWTEELDAVGERIAPHFLRSELRRRAQAYLRGLLSGAERMNSWQLAEVAGNATPYGIQHLLGRANWDADAVRDELRSDVVERLADDESVLVVDETGFIKKGIRASGSSASTPAPSARGRTARWGCFWPTLPSEAKPSSTGSCICPRNGPRIRSVVSGPEYPRRSGCAPSPTLPRRCFRGSSTLG